MSLSARLAAAGFSAVQAQAVEGTVAKALTATGSTQATALALPADVNKFGTVGANTGAILPAMNGGDEMVIFNGGANALSLYPPVGGIINAIAANGAYSIATATPTCFVVCVDPLTYVATQSA